MSRPRTCRANHCTWAAETGRLMCINHWRLLPSPLQAEVTSAWKASPTAAKAVEFIAEKEGRLTRNVFRELANQVKAGGIKTCL